MSSTRIPSDRNISADRVWNQYNQLFEDDLFKGNSRQKAILSYLLKEELKGTSEELSLTSEVIRREAFTREVTSANVRDGAREL